MSSSQFVRVAGILVWLTISGAEAQQAQRGRQFPPGSWTRLEDLPAGRFRTRVSSLPPPARERALAWLKSFHFTQEDLSSLEVDNQGAVFYSDHFPVESSGAESTAEPSIGTAALPLAPFPEQLIFHSRPGAPNVLYLNFTGENVSGTAWNSSEGRTVFLALPFSTDSDYASYSDGEQAAIKRIWQRVAEDYAPFNIDVTTERPATFNNRTAHALITRNTDANGELNPASTAGGVGYINVFGAQSYATYRPVWIYVNNLSMTESYIAEAASHEIGHNLGLSHDGKTDGTEYYRGHGSGSTSWGTIMGACYNRSVSQWSKGEYYLANNTQDDLATISARLTYRTDDHGNTISTATPLIMSETNVASTTPETDPANLKPGNKGVLQGGADVDVFSFSTGNGPVNLAISPWITAAGTRGGNSDLVAELYNVNGTGLLTNNVDTQNGAQIQAVLAAGTYYLLIRGTGLGDPFSATPAGYTGYGSLGQYFISGYVAPPTTAAGSVALTADVNHAGWGSVDPASATYEPGATARITAIPATYYRFVGWTNGASGTDNPLTLLVPVNNFSVEAVFEEILTDNYATPYWWLASKSLSSNFEAAEVSIGANGIPLWQSYIAGLNPDDPASQLRLALTRLSNGTADQLIWKTAPDRLYTLAWTTNLASGFLPVPGGTDLASTVQNFIHPHPGAAAFYRISVRKP